MIVDGKRVCGLLSSRHTTHKYLHLHVHTGLQLVKDVHLQPTMIFSDAGSRPASEKKERASYHTILTWWRSADVAQWPTGRVDVQSAVEQKEAKGKEQEVVKVESELQKTCGGIIAPMNKNLDPLASAGESKVFYNKMKEGEYYRLLRRI